MADTNLHFGAIHLPGQVPIDKGLTVFVHLTGTARKAPS